MPRTDRGFAEPKLHVDIVIAFHVADGCFEEPGRPPGFVEAVADCEAAAVPEDEDGDGGGGVGVGVLWLFG